MDLSKGTFAATNAPREMSNGVDRLSYNLYLDSQHTRIGATRRLSCSYGGRVEPSLGRGRPVALGFLTADRRPSTVRLVGFPTATGANPRFPNRVAVLAKGRVGTDAAFFDGV